MIKMSVCVVVGFRVRAGGSVDGNRSIWVIWAWRKINGPGPYVWVGWHYRIVVGAVIQTMVSPRLRENRGTQGG